MKKLSILILILFLTIVQISFSQEFGTGLNFNDSKYENVQKKAVLTRSLYTELPKYFSLKKYAPTPKSQGQYGTCVGWSTAYAGMTILESVHENRTDVSETTTNTFSPGFIYKQIKTDTDNDCKLGSSIDDALNIMKTKGVCKYDELSEVNCPLYLPSDLFTKASSYKITDYAKIFGMFDSKEFKISAVKKSLSEKNPVIIGMNTPQSFYYTKDTWIPTESSSLTYGGHAMCVIGYDDNRNGGSFEIMNSWGEQWGNDGFIWIKYDDFHNFVKYAYEMIKFKSDKINELYSFAGSVDFIKTDGTISEMNYENGIYKNSDNYRSGTKFRLLMSNSEPAYVYAFGFDATLKTFTIFPHEPGISAALNYTQNSVAIPDEDHFIQTDNTLGKDYLCVLFSKEQLNIEDIKTRIEQTDGSFKERVKFVLNDVIIPDYTISFHQKKIAFSVKNSSKKVAALIIETEHIE
jgi:C1A family cysteine protease